MQGNYKITAPILAKKVPKVLFKGKAIFCYKVHFLIKCLIVELDEIKVQIKVCNAY